MASTKTKTKITLPKSSQRRRYRAHAQKDYSTKARKFVLILIPALVVIIVFSVICANIFNPEHQIKSKLEALATNHYENIIYEKLVTSSNYSGDPETALSRNKDRGLPSYTLRQLLLEDQVKTADAAEYLLKYCDENATTVKFYPEPPYERTSYRVEYTYSCNF